MALTKTVTKVFPTTNTVGMHLKLEDDSVVVIDRDFTENFTKGQGATNEVKTSIGKQMQAAIDEYKTNKTLYNSAAYETARTQISNGLTLLLLFALLLLVPVKAGAAITITSSVVTDWTAVAEAATGESGVIDISSNYSTAVHIQAFLDANDAHEGTEFIVQVSSKSSGDEDWSDYSKFSALVGTSDGEANGEDPLAVGQTVIDVADTGGGFETAPMGKWIAIEDGTLVNSELMWQTAFASNSTVTIQDGTTVEHAHSTILWDIAISKTIVIQMGAGSRARVIVNNGVDLDGTASSLNYKVSKTVTTAL
jgi:hypothetical protein